MVSWWQRRRLRTEDNRQFLQHLAESDVEDNQRLAESYARYPLRLAAVVVSDVFMDTDIGHLWTALRRNLAPDRGLLRDRQRIRTFLHRAESKTGGEESLGVVHFYPPDQARKYVGGGHELQMPAGIDRLGLVLYQFAPGMVMAATVIAAPALTAAEVFRTHHGSPVKQRRDFSLQWQPVETAKTRALEHRLRAFADIDLLPAHRGLLGRRRFPYGTVIVWTANNYPSHEDTAARDVNQVLGIEGWRWWEGTDRRLYHGVPVADRQLGERGGYSMIVTRSASGEDREEFGSAEATLFYYAEHEVNDWLPLLLLGQAALLREDEAGRLRERLSRRANAHLRWFWSLGLGALVGNLSDLQYRLERVRQAADVDGGRRRFQQFPLWVLRPAQASSPHANPTLERRLAPWWRKARAKPRPEPPPFNLRQSSLDGLDRLTRDGLRDLRLSLNRARLLSDIRSANALLLLTAVLAVLTAILVLRAH